MNVPLVVAMIALAINTPIVLANQIEYVEIPLATGVVKLMKPIEIEHADMFLDGGTIFVVLKDKQGKIFPFCLDGRLQALKLWEKPKPRHVFVGATHPKSPEAREILINSPEEKALVEILQDWINENVSDEEQENLSDVSKYKDIIWTDQLFKARKVLQFIEQLKKVRNDG